MNLVGRWRIAEMDLWDLEDIDLIEPAFIEFSQDRTGHFGFIARPGIHGLSTRANAGAPARRVHVGRR